VRRRHLLAVAVLGVFAAMPAAPAGSADREIAAGDFFFGPDYVTVDPGDTVTWRIADSVHDVVSRRGAPASFDSGDLDPGETFALRFDQPGRYEYLCTLHPTLMDGVVQVGPDEQAPRVARLRARRSGTRAVRVGFGLHEEARAVATVASASRPGRVLRRARSRGLVDGRVSLAVPLRGLGAGRYRVSVTAIDRAGNRSRAARAGFQIPRR
jgi:plastocyanin